MRELLPDFEKMCGCKDDPITECLFVASGYMWCRACNEHHRAAECPIDEQGNALVPWEEDERNQQ